MKESLMILLIIAFLYLLNEHLTAKHLSKNVSWCLTESLSDIVFNLSEQCEIPIDAKYTLNYTNNIKAVSKILEEYKKYLSKIYSEQHLSVNFKNKALRLTNIEFFILTLSGFLNKYDDAMNLSDEALLCFLEYRENSTTKTKFYKFTDFGIAFNKLCYLAYTFCEKNRHTHKFVSYNRSGNIKTRLDENGIEFF